MADITLNLNGVDTVLSDDGAGGYTIDLRNSIARAFVRAEKTKLQEERDRLQEERDSATAERDVATGQKDFHAARRTAAIAAIGLVSARLDEINLFLAGQGE